MRRWAPSVDPVDSADSVDSSNSGGGPVVSGIVPVALFAYDRVDLLGRTLDGLRANAVPLIYAFSDGPRSEAVAERVSAVRRLLRAVDWAKVVLTERSENLGLGRSIVDGTSIVFAQHQQAIVCEDDLVVAPGAYAYLCAALAHYENDSRVMSVSGWTHPLVTPPGVGGAPFFSARVNTYFWGAWARSWQGMGEGSALDRLRRCRERGQDPARYGRDIPDMAAAEGARNLWAVRWIAQHLAGGGLSLCPPWTMVDHVGIDPRATNAAVLPIWDQRIDRAPPPVPEPWPEPVEHPGIAALWRRAVEMEYAQAESRSRRSLAARLRSAIGRFLRRGRPRP
jgi:hypothetical protein